MLHKNIVIGGSLEALKFAYENDYPILCIPQKPHFFRPKCLAEWEHLAFLLSLSGQMPMSSNISSIRIDEEQREIKCFTKNSRVVTYKYEQAYVVDDHGVGGSSSGAGGGGGAITPPTTVNMPNVDIPENPRSQSSISV